MTNFDRITCTTPIELADVLYELSENGNALCDYCAYVMPQCCRDCRSGVYKWLNQQEEAEDEDN